MGWFDRIRKSKQDDTTLPRFRYHPDPLATGAFVTSDAACVRCQRARGYVYTRKPYSVAEPGGPVCPWCIGDGSAARSFRATFVQESEDPLPRGTRKALFERTPGYESWQGEMWLCHHGDACEFHGDATRADLNALTESEEALFLEENPFIDDWWADMKANHNPKASAVGVYKFRCRQCGLTRLGVDMS